MREHGGVVGRALHEGTATAFSEVGVTVVAIFLAVAGVLLITGASVAGVIRATSAQVADTTRSLRRPREDREDEREREAPPSHSPFAPPEPEDEEVVVRPVTRAGELDGALRFPDLFGTPAEMAVGPARVAEAEPDPEPLEDPVAEEPEPEPEAIDDEDDTLAAPARAGLDLELPVAEREFALPETRLLKRSTPEQARPDTAGQAQTAARLVEALGHFNVAAEVIGAVAGPHITRYELQLAPGREDVEGRRTSRTTSPTRWPPRRSASSPRSRASARSASRSPTATAGSSPSATSTASRRRAPRR